MPSDADLTREAQKIWNALRPMVRQEATDVAKAAVRAKKMTVMTPPNGSTVGVAEPFGPTLDVPYSTAISHLVVGDSVWVQYFYDNASTMFVVCKGDGQTFGGEYPLTIAQGGTGLTVSPSLLVNLSSTSAANVLTASPRPGVTGTLPIANGGTGAANVSDALKNLHVYYSVAQLGLTAGSATLAAVWSALPNRSIAFFPGGDFTASELPGGDTVGSVRIFRNSASRGSIEWIKKTFNSVQLAVTAYMSLNGSNAPSGEWTYTVTTNDILCMYYSNTGEGSITINVRKSGLSNSTQAQVWFNAYGAGYEYDTGEGTASFGLLTDITPVTVPQGGTGATSFASGAALIGNGTNAVTTRAITNLTSDGTVTANTNLITANTLVHYANYRLGDYLPLYGKAITSGDLNDYVTPGKYYVTGANASNITNAPVTTFMFIDVLRFDGKNDSNQRTVQFVYTTGNNFYMREYSNGAWQGWVSVITTKTAISSPSSPTIPTAAIGVQTDTGFGTGVGKEERKINMDTDGFISYERVTWVNGTDNHEEWQLATLNNDGVLPVDQGGTGANNAADARANLGIGSAQANRYQLASGGSKVSLTLGGNTCLFSIIRTGTSSNPSARCVCVAEYWSNNIAVFGELPSQIVLQKSSNSNVITIQNNRTTAVVLVCVSGIFAAVDGTDTITQTATLINYSYYVPGDTYKITGPLGLDGYITSDAKGINFTVIVKKDLGYINMVTVTALTGVMRGVNGAIANSTTSTNWLTQSGVTVTASVNGPNVIRISMAFDSVPNNATANTIANLAASLTLSFS